MLSAFAAHWSLAHAMGNALGIALFSWLIARRESVRALLTVFALGLAFQIVALSWMHGEYRGASGFLYALATYAFLGIRGDPILRAAIGGAGIALVIRDAAGFATSPFLPAGVATAWPIHMAGIAAGAVARLLDESDNAAVGAQRLAVDPSAIGAHEECHGRGDVLRGAEPLEGRGLGQAIDRLWRLAVQE